MTATDELIEFSKYLFNETTIEDYAHTNQALRTCIHKSYYAAYHECKLLGDKLPETENINTGSHDRLIQRLKNVPVASAGNKKNAKRIKTISLWLLQAKTLRCKADYSLDSEIDVREIEQHDINVRKILRDLPTIVHDLTPQQKTSNV
ncbi:hypothetical protein [Marinomonas sp. FW-1]|uniref:hypothetical protein n=1 Tax=Marinomonas sp. FW-1 TaxID=2071621 RepID=UPI0010C0F7D2|nr:hypothetical protein [Marinomonas sp. FW-1]